MALCQCAAALQASELGSLASNVSERSKKFNFPVVHLAPHYVRRTMPSPAAGCQLFIVAGPEPLSHNPKAPQLLLLACRGAASIMMGPKLVLEVLPIRVDTTSVYTGALMLGKHTCMLPMRVRGLPQRRP